MLTFVSFILVMGVIVFVHEFGHLVAAKRNGIIVEEFGFGYPPRLIKLFERDGTVYSINAIPFGGFARMRGEDDPTQPGSFAAASRLGRAVTLLAGPLMNIALAIVLFAALALAQGLPDTSRPGTVVVGVVEDSAAAAGGIRTGDRFVAADGAAINSYDDITRFTASRAGQPVAYTIMRGERFGKGGQTLVFTVTPQPNEEGQGKLGVYLGLPTRPAKIWEAAGAGFSSTWNIISATFTIPANLIREGKPLKDFGFVGPVGIAVTTGSVVRQASSEGSLAILIQFIAILSTALGLTNLLPLPALDGGRLMFVLLETIRRRRIEPAHEGLVHLIGFGLLLVLVALLSVREIAAVINGTFPALGIR